MLKRGIPLILPLVLWLPTAEAQPKPHAARDAKLIGALRQLSVDKLDDALPDLSFEDWLAKESGPGAKYHWEVNDCGEESGTPGESGPVSICVEVDSDLEDGREILIFVADDRPASARKPAPPQWKIFFAQLTTPHEKINLRRLSDLPAALIKTHQLEHYPEIAK